MNSTLPSSVDMVNKKEQNCMEAPPENDKQLQIPTVVPVQTQVNVQLKQSTRRLVLIITIIISCTILIGVGIGVGLHYYYKPKISEGPIIIRTISPGQYIQIQPINIRKNIKGTSPINMNFTKTTYYKRNSNQRYLKQGNDISSDVSKKRNSCVSGQLKGFFIRYCKNKLNDISFNMSTFSGSKSALADQQTNALQQHILSSDISMTQNAQNIVTIHQKPTSIIQLKPDGLIVQELSTAAESRLLQASSETIENGIASNITNITKPSSYLTKKFVEARIKWMRSIINTFCLILREYYPDLQCSQCSSKKNSSRLLQNSDASASASASPNSESNKTSQTKKQKTSNIKLTNRNGQSKKNQKVHKNNKIQKNKNTTQFQKFMSKDCWLIKVASSPQLQCYGNFNYSSLNNSTKGYKITIKPNIQLPKQSKNNRKRLTITFKSNKENDKNQQTKSQAKPQTKPQTKSQTKLQTKSQAKPKQNRDQK